jgi:molybdopterin molybdotransferase
MRIMTGAPIPDGADTIVPVEELAFEDGGEGERVRVTAPAPAGAFVRGAGLDLPAGEVALDEGRDLNPHDLAVLASLGVDEVEVGRRPRVIIVSTGDELVDAGARLAPGAIRDGNTPMLAALVAEAGGFVVATSRLKDDPDAVASTVRTALAEADVVLTIGGVSEGAFDPVKDAIAAIGGIRLWRVAMKPGRPQAFGAPAGRLFFGLPGNPASVACVFEALVRPALRGLQGFADVNRPRVAVRTADAIASRAGRTDFVRVTLEPGDPLPLAREAGPGVSGHVMPQSRAHGLLVVPEEVETLPAGARAEVWLWRWPGAPAA